MFPFNAINFREELMKIKVIFLSILFDLYLLSFKHIFFFIFLTPLEFSKLNRKDFFDVTDIENRNSRSNFVEDKNTHKELK